MATSKLQIEVGNLLDKELPEYRIRENFRPDWLISSEKTRLELDFFIVELKIGIEVQGQQHYQFTPFFHKDKNSYLREVRLDKEKRDLCEAIGISFFEVFTLTDAIVIVKDIQAKYRQKPKYFYQETNLNHAQRKQSKSSEQERLQRAANNIALFRAGKISASKEKVLFWERVVLNNGKEIDLA